MTEQLLQYIWQFQYYNNTNLLTTRGESVHIIYPGIHNSNQGPDFLNAKIKCGDTLLAGSIEIHVNASEWEKHKHSSDKNYNNVILHIVWEENVTLQLHFPVVELKSRVSNLLLKKYQSLMNAQHFIPCEQHISSVNDFVISAWKERLTIERLQEKAIYVKHLLQQNNQHWEEVFWQMLARNFGLKINSDAFESMAKSIPLSILGKHKHQLLQLEALLMGQAGLLENVFVDDYAVLLQKEYRFLKQKYVLEKTHFSVFFLRMRPANFPTLRISQLAHLVFKSNHLFSKIKEASTTKEIEKMLDVVANDYWHYHYNFDELTTFKKKALGKQMIQNIITNTVLPVLYAYGWYNNNEMYKSNTLRLAGQLLPEKNNITKGFEHLGVANKSVYDSQALIQLKNSYCNKKRCLECAIGNSILKS